MAVSAASMRTAGEAYAPAAKGEARADGELTRCGGLGWLAGWLLVCMVPGGE
jgi:hypothetical protein